MPMSASLRRQLIEFIDEATPLMPLGMTRATYSRRLASNACCSVLFITCNRAARKEVTGANVLVAIFSEKQSQAVYFLGMQDVTSTGCRELHLARYAASARRTTDAERGGKPVDTRRRSLIPVPLDKYATNLNQRADRRQNRSADRSRHRDRANRSDSVPATQEQSRCTWARQVSARRRWRRGWRA